MPSNQIIQRLPDYVINQIAAGEVIQRPASVVKELVENALDAGATQIDVIIKDAGKTLIQVVDNGKGMSPEDAQTAFERHATSKIRATEDLYQLHTMGFRGEALASIVSIAHVELQTRRPEDELGTLLRWTGPQLDIQEPTACPAGTSLAVKNLFFNVPARRKFLKKEETEMRNIINCFQQIALVYPEIAFNLTHNNEKIYQLPAASRRQRIEALFGRKIGSQLLPVESDTLLVRISGYVGLPELAQKRGANQYFFVNGRYIQHPYFNRAVTMAYEKIIPSDMRPSYFIYFDVDPADLDVNIHPTKTEVKFAQEQAIFPILTAAVREILGKSNITPSLDFEDNGGIVIPTLPDSKEDLGWQVPSSGYDPGYDPFKSTSRAPSSETSYKTHSTVDQWEKLFAPDTTSTTPSSQEPAPTLLSTNYLSPCLQINQKYLLEPQDDGLLIVDQHRAHVRILYERYLQQYTLGIAPSQQLLFPEIMELTANARLVLAECSNELRQLGFQWDDTSSGIEVTGMPSTLDPDAGRKFLQEILQEEEVREGAAIETMQQRIALKLARHTALRKGDTLTEAQGRHLIQELYQCEDCCYAPDGGRIAFQITLEMIEKELK